MSAEFSRRDFLTALATVVGVGMVPRPTIGNVTYPVVVEALPLIETGSSAVLGPVRGDLLTVAALALSPARAPLLLVELTVSRPGSKGRSEPPFLKWPLSNQAAFSHRYEPGLEVVMQPGMIVAASGPAVVQFGIKGLDRRWIDLRIAFGAKEEKRS